MHKSKHFRVNFLGMWPAARTLNVNTGAVRSVYASGTEKEPVWRQTSESGSEPLLQVSFDFTPHTLVPRARLMKLSFSETLTVLLQGLQQARQDRTYVRKCEHNVRSQRKDRHWEQCEGFWLQVRGRFSNYVICSVVCWLGARSINLVALGIFFYISQLREMVTELAR